MSSPTPSRATARAKRSTETRLNALPETFSQAEAARLGLPPATLYRLRDAGRISAIARGLYKRTTDPADLDLLEIAIRAPNATLCLTSALARHGLTDAIPETIDIAIPRGSYAPGTTTPTTWHRFDRDTFNLGRTTIPIEGTLELIGIYDPERCIADMYRLRGVEGHEAATDALRRWLKMRGNSPADLLRVARKLPRAEGPIRRELAILL